MRKQFGHLRKRSWGVCVLKESAQYVTEGSRCAQVESGRAAHECGCGNVKRDVRLGGEVMSLHVGLLLGKRGDGEVQRN